MWKLCFLVLISIVFSHDVYRFTRTENKAPLPLKSETDCPDGGECGDEQTCCQMADGSYGCCLFPNAVCCSDNVHCCPENTICDLVHSQCKSKENKFVSFLKTKVLNKNRYDTLCPDRVFDCNEKQTCCLARSGSYACCPFPNAVCCADKVHCCSQGTVCNLTSMICEYKSNILSVVKPKSVSIPVKSNKCPDNSQCQDSETCCPESNGDYGCCPFPNAVCCSDHAHCCPQGTTCNLDQMKCETKGNTVSLMKRKTASIPVKSVVCPDNSQCDDGQTCCQEEDNSYGCCPMPNAVCCSDKIHCCPQGTVCNLTSMTCEYKSNILSVVKPKSVSIPVKSNKCPDKSQCQDSETCCPESNGDYGCCPFPNAVCCSDHAHCCPQGTTCNLDQMKCETKGNTVSLMKRKTASIPVKFVVCPDNSQCDDGQTCCQEEDNSYGCCPMPNAVCCSDKIHCCPQGTICNLTEMKCDSKDNIISLTTPKTASIPLKSIRCPDNNQCGDGETCCPMINGKYGCCPMANAVCCSDKIHCCSEGTSCNVAENRCDSVGNNTSFMKRKIVSIPIKSVTCPDNSQCEDDNTCCPKCDGTYSCCELSNGVCCSDYLHCCPHGTKCNLSNNTCDGFLSIKKLETNSLTYKP